ncbi:MAG TPA: BatD family protein [Candidatus Limnocylindria bacterium]|nr:BatD family protein [Candidatus Limnocylindria bacterium]
MWTCRATLLALLGLAAAPPVDAAVEIQARLERRTLAVGETTTLEVVVRGVAIGASEPEFAVPEGLEVLGSGREQNFSWVNGRSTVETVFRYEIGPTAAGRYALGPIDVRVSGQTYRSGVVGLDVSAAPVRVGAAGGGPATLVVDLLPPSPYVGQLAILRVRLVQRTSLAEDPHYSPPATPGFWTDKPAPPESFYGDQGNQRVLVTETRTRLYPLTVGQATIGEAMANLVIADERARDPLAWLHGSARRQLVVKSSPLRVRVRPLPGGAPAGFTGAVGAFEVRWVADRPATSRDVPVTMRLDVRGIGNLPLIRPPELASPDFEVFASSVEDSLGMVGGAVRGRKRFQWTVLPRRQGRLELSAPSFAWFDPAASRYQSAAAPAVRIEVGPSLFAAGSDEEFPAVFAAHPLEPGARGPEPWAYALVGLFAGGGFALWRTTLRRSPDSAVRAQQRELLRAVGRGTGADFWRAAEEASAWLADRGASVGGLRDNIVAARYGGGTLTSDPERLRRALVEHLGRAVPAPSRRLPNRLGAVLLATVAVVLAVQFGPTVGSSAALQAARRADQSARAGDLRAAHAEWETIWRRSGPHPALAARLAWSDAEAGAIGPAAAWVLRGELAEPRDPALRWVSERVREGGGLVGAGAARLPLTRLEWSLLALAAGLGAGALWPGARATLACAALAIVAGAVHPVEGLLARRSGHAVVVKSVLLEGADLELQPGQVVTVTSRAGDRVRIRAGRDEIGVVPPAAVQPVFGRREG